MSGDPTQMWSDDGTGPKDSWTFLGHQWMDRELDDAIESYIDRLAHDEPDPDENALDAYLDPFGGDPEGD